MKYPFGFISIIKWLPIEILKLLFTTLRNQYNKYVFMRVEEDGALARYSEFMRTCHNMNIIVQNKCEDSYSLHSEVKSKIRHWLISQGTLLLAQATRRKFGA